MPSLGKRAIDRLFLAAWLAATAFTLVPLAFTQQKPNNSPDPASLQAQLTELRSSIASAQEDSKRDRVWIDADKRELETQIPPFQGLEDRLRIAEEQLDRIQSEVGIYRSSFRDIPELDRARIEFTPPLPRHERLLSRQSESLLAAGILKRIPAGSRSTSYHLAEPAP
jgi:hypothetical protein